MLNLKLTQKQQFHRNNYSKAFFVLDDMMPKMDNRNLKDAKIHEYLIKHGKTDHATISFRAVIEHIKGELKNPESSQDYLNVFNSYIWCQRLKDGLPL